MSQNVLSAKEIIELSDFDVCSAGLLKTMKMMKIINLSAFHKICSQRDTFHEPSNSRTRRKGHSDACG